jgi:hypothetical protein
MKKLLIAMTVGAAALVGGSTANAADNGVKPKGGADVTQSSTDFSSQRRHWHRHHHWGRRHWGHRHHWRHGYYRPYYNSYGYYGRPYYGGGPSVTFSFGGGGYRGW